jgi:hypothetical protein
MGDILKIVRFGAVRVPARCDCRDRHPASAKRAGQEETRQVRWGSCNASKVGGCTWGTVVHARATRR